MEKVELFMITIHIIATNSFMLLKQSSGSKLKEIDTLF